jgi:site-specific DNA-methyltransferase (adenine-specific)
MSQEKTRRGNARVGDRLGSHRVGSVLLSDNLAVLRELPSASFDLIYIDPPFNTGRTQAHTRIRTVRSPEGDRTGFQGARYRTIRLGSHAFPDAFGDYLGYLEPRLIEARRVLAPEGSLYFHSDCRESHYCKVLLDCLFGRASFLNEIIWAYDYGARSRRRWPAKHDNILVYVKDPRRYYFDIDAVERIPYMAPGLVGPEKAARGKTPTDTWWHTIVPTNGSERTGYPAQKPLGVVRRIVQASSPPGGRVLDFFAGSGRTGEACLRENRRFVLVDNNRQAWQVMRRRFRGVAGIEWIRGAPPALPASRAEKAEKGARDGRLHLLQDRRGGDPVADGGIRRGPGRIP